MTSIKLVDGTYMNLNGAFSKEDMEIIKKVTEPMAIPVVEPDGNIFRYDIATVALDIDSNKIYLVGDRTEDNKLKYLGGAGYEPESKKYELVYEGKTEQYDHAVELAFRMNEVFTKGIYMLVEAN